jgi:hypothetical protein
MLAHTIFNFTSDGVTDLYDAIANSRYTDANRGTSKESHMKPVHDDIIADYRSAFENLCCSISTVLRNQRKDLGPDMKKDNFAGNLLNYLKL